MQIQAANAWPLGVPGRPRDDYNIETWWNSSLGPGSRDLTDTKPGYQRGEEARASR
jgi:hypothetical protein